MESKSFQLWATSSLYLLHCHIFWLCGGTTKEGRNISRTPRQKHCSFVQFLLSSHFSLSLCYDVWWQKQMSHGQFCATFPQVFHHIKLTNTAALANKKTLHRQYTPSFIYLFILLNILSGGWSRGKRGLQNRETKEERERESKMEGRAEWLVLLK